MHNEFLNIVGLGLITVPLLLVLFGFTLSRLGDQGRREPRSDRKSKR